MALDSQLLAVLACPEDKGPLYYVADEDILYNPRLARAYQVRDGIPVMLVEEATSLDADSVARLDAKVASESISPTFTA
jgi:uncharacterized protein YbaR (Trm112 family)